MYKLTSQQKNIFMVDKVYPNTSVNTVMGIFNIEKDLDIICCQKVLNNMIKRNDSFRIRIHENVDVCQSFDEYKEEVFDVIDVKNNDEYEAYINSQIGTTFDVCRDKLYDFKILNRGNSKGSIIIKTHHIISDAWTFKNICEFLSNDYTNEFEMKHNRASEKNDFLLPSYKEYIEASNKYLDSSKYETDKEFWKENLKGSLKQASLSNKNETTNIKASRYSVNLSKELNEEINEFAKINKVSAYSIFMSIIYAYISRVTNTDDIVLGTPVLGRSNFKEKQMMGAFISTIPLRTKLNNEMTFSELMVQTSQSTMQAFRHQKYPLYNIIKDYKANNNTQNKLFNMMLSYQNARANILNPERYNTDWTFSNKIQSELEIHIMDMDSTGILNMNYDYLTDLFDEVEIQYLHKRIIKVIRQVLDNKDIKIKDVDIVSDDEKNKIARFNNTSKLYDYNQSLMESFTENVIANPFKTAVIFNDEKYNYRLLDEMSNNLAGYLKIEKNIKAQDKISIYTNRSIDMIVSILATLKLNATYIPIDITFPKERVEYMIENSDTRYILSNQNLKLDNITAEIIELDNFNYVNKCKDLLNKPKEDDITYMIYTSGTTGKPKACMIKHKGVQNLIFAAKDLECLTSEYVYGAFSTYSFDISVLELILPLVIGGTIILANEKEQLDADLMAKAIDKYKVQVINMTPTRMRILLNNSKASLVHIKNIMLGGEVFPSSVYTELRKHTNADIYDGYGPTEITVWSSAKKITNKDNINIGKPLNNTTAYILDENNNVLPIGISGELAVGGEGVAKGYYKKDELTKEKFVTLDNIGRVYKTGDICYLDFNLELHYVSRKDKQVKLNGLRIEIDDIETNINSIEKIKECVVVINDNRLCAYYTAIADVSKDDIIDFLSEKLPSYMVPKLYVRVDKFEITTLGKINTAVLPAPGFTIEKDNFEKPTTKEEKIFTVEVERILNIKDVGVNTDIIDLGMDSLSLINLVSYLATKNIRISYNDIYKYKTIKKILMYSNMENEEYRIDKDISNYDYNNINNNIKINSLSHLGEGVDFKTDLGNVLLTGVTGFLGSHILYEFLKTQKGMIYCPIRKKNNVDVNERMKYILNYFFNGEYIEEIGKRIIVMDCDITDEESLQNINTFDSIDVIINSAACVKHYGDDEYFYKINYEIVKSLASLSKKYNIKFIQISTLSVSGNILEGGYINQDKVLEKTNYTEDKLYINQKLDNIYIYTKFLAERYLLNEIENGLNVVVIRVGNLTGRYLDGKFQPNVDENAFTKRIKSLSTIKVLPNNLEEFYLEFSPIDYVAKAVMLLAGVQNKYNLYHLFNHNHLFLKEYNDILEPLGLSFKFLNSDEFKEKIAGYMKTEEGIEKIKGILIDLSKDNDLNYETNTKIKDDFTYKILLSLGFKWPNITKRYITMFIEYLRNIGYID